MNEEKRSLDTGGKWLRRIGLWMIAAYAAFGLAIWVSAHILPGLTFAGGLGPLFLVDGLLYLAALAGVLLLNVGTALGIVGFKRGRSTAPFTARELGVASVVVLMAIVGLANSTSRAEAVVVNHDKPAPARPYKELYPQRASAEPGDLERKIGETATLGDVSVTVTKTQVIERRGEFDIFKPGRYLIVFFDVTNSGSKPEYFLNAAEWTFDVPGKGHADPEFPFAPMESEALDDPVAPGATVAGTVALYLGAERGTIAPGDYFAIWYPEGGCAVSDANYLPFDYCRAVWPVAQL